MIEDREKLKDLKVQLFKKIKEWLKLKGMLGNGRICKTKIYQTKTKQNIIETNSLLAKGIIMGIYTKFSKILNTIFSQPFNPLTLEYHDTEAGKNLRDKDDVHHVK